MKSLSRNLKQAVLYCRVVGLWKEDLAQQNKKAADSLADPTEYENLFPEFQEALRAEQVCGVRFLREYSSRFLCNVLFWYFVVGKMISSIEHLLCCSVVCGTMV